MKNVLLSILISSLLGSSLTTTVPGDKPTTINYGDATLSVSVEKPVEKQGIFEPLIQWNRLEWIFNNPTEELEYYKNEYYKGAMPAGFKQDAQGNYYLSVPRWNKGIPATLNKIVMVDGKAKLQAYPSNEMNKEGDPNALQSVLGYEIDEKGYMWILDQGHVAGAPSKDGSQKLVCWDMKQDKLVASYKIGDNLASYQASFLNDIAVDNENGFVYIADSGIFTKPLQGSIIVFNMKTKEFRRVLFQHFSTMDVPDFRFKIAGRDVWENDPMRTGADGIALSSDRKTLYWTPLTGRHLYSIDTTLLKDFNTPQEKIAAAVKDNGSKGTNTDGMTADNKGNIYYTMLEGQGVGKYNPATKQFSTVVSDKSMIWVDGMQILNNGDMIFIHNNLHTMGDKNFDWSNPTNFVIWKTHLGDGIKSYLEK